MVFDKKLVKIIYPEEKMQKNKKNTKKNGFSLKNIKNSEKH
jgi:hypothetical protein